jgi:hypothetical protein
MKFEYKLVHHKANSFFGGKVDLNEMTDEYNSFGKDGWELDTNTNGGVSNLIIAI